MATPAWADEPVLEISPLRSASDATTARLLLAAQRSWLTSSGIVASAETTSAGSDYDEPERFYNRVGGLLLIARMDGEPVGVVGMRCFRRRPPTAELRRLYVAESARGLGVGRALIESILGCAQQMGYHEIVLETVSETLTNAARLYRSVGFEERSPIRLLPLPGQIAMSRRLRDLPAQRLQALTSEELFFPACV
jgi:GNAT superfamily N-acetyltransferase